jgi:hypothetical protein
MAKVSKWVTRVEFCKIAGLTRNHLDKYIMRGQIALNSKMLIDREVALKFLEQSRLEKSTKYVDNVEEIKSITEARLEFETYRAKNEKIKYDQALGKLIPVDEYEAKITKLIAEVRSRVLSFKKSMSAKLLRKETIKEVEIIIDKEVKKMLTDMSKIEL